MSQEDKKFIPGARISIHIRGTAAGDVTKHLLEFIFEVAKVGNQSPFTLMRIYFLSLPLLFCLSDTFLSLLLTYLSSVFKLIILKTGIWSLFLRNILSDHITRHGGISRLFGCPSFHSLLIDIKRKYQNSYLNHLVPKLFIE